MDSVELNLGPFNDCIDDMSEKPFHIVTYGLAINKDTPENRKALTRAVELKVLSVIYGVIEDAGLNMSNLDVLDRVKILVRSVLLRVDAFDTLQITAEVGVCVFAGSVVVG